MGLRIAEWRLDGFEGAGAFVDELPEVFGFGELFVFAGAGEVAAEEEVLEGVGVHDALDADGLVVGGEVDAVVAGAAAVEFFAFAVEDAEAFGEAAFSEVGFGDVEGFEELELDLGGQLGELGGADFVEDDLDHGVS